jgi:hypothetical protein
MAELRGRRIIVGVPGIGFRDGLRADNPIVQSGRRLVPVLAEHDYYRAELEQIEMFTLLVPIERVWVEHVGRETQLDARSTDQPGVREPSPVVGRAPILGLRLVQLVPDGFVRDLRAATDVYRMGVTALARVCSELEWYRWALQGTVPSTVEVPAELLWCE